jgi:hypothetical protein
MELDRAHATPASLRTSINDEHNFEAIFQIPATHRLVLVRSRSRGCPLSAIFWEHDEYDTLGRLVARYRSFEQVNDLGERQRGWRKFDSHGHLVSEDDDLQYAPRLSAVIRNRDGNSTWQ